jgi:hypothetical protein
MTVRKIALFAGFSTLAMFATPAMSQTAWYEGKWCAYERLGKGAVSSRCDLPTWEACRAWMNAQSGTWCTENPRYRMVEKPVRGKPRRVIQ